MDILEALKEQNTGTNIFNWRSGGIFNWIVILSKIDDQKTVDICGTDSAVYLHFLSQSAKFFGILSIFSLIMIPIYFTGDPTETNDFRQHVG